MAIGTFVHVPRLDDYIGGRTRQKVVEYTGPTTYTTDGESGLKSLCGFAEITRVDFMPLKVGSTKASAVAAKYIPVYAIDTDSIVLVLLSTLAQPASSADCSDGKWRIIVHGS